MTIFYLDIECDDLRGSTLLQIACITDKHNQFNVFIKPPFERILSERCNELTGFHSRNGRLFQYGNELTCLPRKEALQKFSDFVYNKSEGSTIFIAHNGSSYDYRILLRHFSKCGLRLGANIKCCDSLSVIKKFYNAFPTKRPAGDQGYSLSSLADYYRITNALEHNALADSITLKRVIDFFILDHNLPVDFFVTETRDMTSFA